MPAIDSDHVMVEKKTVTQCASAAACREANFNKRRRRRRRPPAHAHPIPGAVS